MSRDLKPSKSSLEILLHVLGIPYNHEIDLMSVKLHHLYESSTTSIQRPESATLCSQCTQLAPLLVEISAASKPGNAHTDWWNSTYGRFRAGIKGLAPDSCELCCILQQAFRHVSGFSSTDTVITISNEVFARYKGLQHGTCLFNVGEARMALAPSRPVVKINEGEDIQAFTGRFILPLINPSLVRSWLDRCREHVECQPDHSSKDFDFAFRLIDVQNGCIVDAPRDARYIALSYVWGSVQQVMLNKRTRKYLEQKGSISIAGLKEPGIEFSHLDSDFRGKVIPRTIRDAILFCQTLTERYLWTDSLCILQDDEYQQSSGAWTNVDKMAQIPKMHIIYGASLLTIIAACGTDSNAGLPGVHNSNTRTKQVAGKIGDQFFVSVAGDPMHDFWRSMWAQRGWTFQEFLLSKRHLIFLPDQVVYHCSILSWCEDYSLEFVDEPENHLAVPAWTRSYKLRPLQLPIRSKWSNEVFFPALFINNFFKSWLRDFLKRRLTVSSDILFAFDGALSASTRHIGRFHHGLPIEHFCESLHWLVGLDSMYMEAGKQPHHGLTQRRDGFPSWSWTGWLWDLPDYEEFHTNYQAKAPTQWCRIGIWGTRNTINNDLELWQITSPDTERWARLNFFPNTAFKDNIVTISKVQNTLSIIRKYPIPSNCIVLKTVTSFLYLSSHRQSEWTPSLQAYSTPTFLPENLIGGIKLPSKWQERIGHRLQVIITGSYFYGPDPRSPDRTDEMDPSIDMLVVQSFEDGTMERLMSFVTRFSCVGKLVWRDIVAVLR